MLKLRFFASEIINWHHGHPTLFFCLLLHKKSCSAPPHTEIWFSCPAGCNTLVRHGKKNEHFIQSWLFFCISHSFICISGFVSCDLPLWRGSLSHMGWWHPGSRVAPVPSPWGPRSAVLFSRLIFPRWVWKGLAAGGFRAILLHPFDATALKSLWNYSAESWYSF